LAACLAKQLQDFQAGGSKTLYLNRRSPLLFQQTLINGKGLDFAGDLRYAFLIMGIRAKFF
jgi:hypothetical protein